MLGEGEFVGGEEEMKRGESDSGEATRRDWERELTFFGFAFELGC